MAVEELKSSGKLYVSVKYGKLVGYVPQDDERYSEKIVKDRDGNDTKIGGYFLSRVRGIINKIEYVKKETDNGKWTELHVTFDDSEVLTLKAGMISDFISVLASADLTKEVKVSAYNNKKGYARLWVTQSSDGKTALNNHFYNFETKEYMNGYPAPSFEWKEASDDDKTIYRAETNKFLKQYLEENIIPNLQEVTSSPEQDMLAEIEEAEDGSLDVEFDDSDF